MILDDPDEFNPYAFPPKPANEAAARGSDLDRLEPAPFGERIFACLIDIACTCALLVLAIAALAVLGANDNELNR